MVLYLLGIGAHLMLQNRGVEEAVGEGRMKYATAALVSALVLGWLLHVFTEIPETALDLLTALIAGMVLYNSLKGELSDDLQARPVAFFAGAFLIAVSHWVAA